MTDVQNTVEQALPTPRKCSFAFHGTGRDRAHELRAKPDALNALRPQAYFIAIWRGMILSDGQKAALLPQDHPIFGPSGPEVFLGYHLGKAIFGRDLSAWSPEEGLPHGSDFDAGRQNHPHAPQGFAFYELRRIMAALSPDEAEIAATARALLEWHKNAGFCPKCGGRTAMGGAGWNRACTSCQALHFPRTDPVVIMLITHDNRLLLGRSPGWPETMFSTLAGFIEPGETMEAAVAREVKEETGITCDQVRYVTSQPWPFPASLMLACHARATSQEITIDPAELEEALWLSREELLDVFLGKHAKISPPREGSVARYLMESWLSGAIK